MTDRLWSMSSESMSDFTNVDVNTSPQHNLITNAELGLAEDHFALPEV